MNTIKTKRSFIKEINNDFFEENTIEFEKEDIISFLYRIYKNDKGVNRNE